MLFSIEEENYISQPTQSLENLLTSAKVICGTAGESFRLPMKRISHSERKPLRLISRWQWQVSADFEGLSTSACLSSSKYLEECLWSCGFTSAISSSHGTTSFLPLRRRMAASMPRP